MEIKKFGRTTHLKIIGDVNHVLEGKVAPHVLYPVNSSQIAFGLGGATFQTEKQVGDAMNVCGKSYVEACHGSLQREQIPSTFKTAFFMCLEKNAEPDALFHAQFAKGKTLDSLYEDIIKNYPDGFAFAGQMKFSAANGTYLKKPPIFGENITGAKEDEYWAPLEHLQDQEAILFGVVITSKGEKSFGKEKVAKGFYQNPKEAKKAPFLSHTHAALIESAKSFYLPNTPHDFFAVIGALKVRGIRHFLTQSVCQEGVFGIFKIDSIRI